jgi:hypothetical protein
MRIYVAGAFSAQRSELISPTAARSFAFFFFYFVRRFRFSYYGISFYLLALGSWHLFPAAKASVHTLGHVALRLMDVILMPKSSYSTQQVQEFKARKE